jgi:hypothetical protein
MVQGVEKEFLLKAFYDEQASILCRYNRVTYTLHIEKLDKTKISFKADQNIPGLGAGKKIDLSVDYKGVAVVFVVEVSSISGTDLVTTFPDLLYKNLDRAYPRVSIPAEMQTRIMFPQERYFLPVIADPKENTMSPPPDLELKTFQDITAELASWARNAGGEYRLLLFKEAKPASLEEQILVKTGKILFLPSIKEPLPESDPGNKNRIILREHFTGYFESIGLMSSFFDAALEQFIQSKQIKNICGDVWTPIGFKDYTAGYIHFWVSQEDKTPVPYAAVETLSGFANALTAVLQKKGYFEAFSLKDKPISVQGLDISAGGIRFSCPKSYISDMLTLNAEIDVKLVTPKRTITIKTKILRRYEEKKTSYYGCHFLDLVPEDIRFLYEYIYGKPFTDSGGVFF